MTLTLKDMRSNLISYDEVINRLQKTEPLSSEIIDSTSTTNIQLAEDWAEETKNSGMTDLVPATISVNGTEHQFTKEGILQATSLIGLRSAYVLKTPKKYIEEQLNYWFNSGLGEAAHKLVVVDGAASAFVKPTIVSFSNLELAQSVLDGINQFYGKEVEVLADFKFLNTLNRTDVRFIVPTALSAMRDTNMADVPPGSMDVWSSGINMTNSLTGKSKTSVEAYLFRWWSTSGAIRENDDVGTWNRKHGGQQEDTVYEWASTAVTDILSDIESLIASVQSLNKVKLKGATADVLKKVFTDHKVPVTQQNTIQDTLISANEITMYSLMNAVTTQANNPTLAPERVDKLMRIGGSLPEHYFDDTKARIFAQGQAAGPDATNPFLVKTD